MSIDPDEFDFERSRTAVAVACLQWLRCTGPVVEARPDRVTSPVVAELLRDGSTIVSPAHHSGHPHPLWDRWLDG